MSRFKNIRRLVVQYTDLLVLWVIIRRYCLMRLSIGMRNL